MFNAGKSIDVVKAWKWSFADAIASGVDSKFASVISLGAGMSVSQTGGNLVIAAGTTAYAETIIRSLETFDMSGVFRYGLTLSQRIANNNFVVEWTDLFGDNLNISITGATTAQITKPKHGLSARDIGKGVWIGALTVPNTLAQRVTIASIVDDDNFTITGTGMSVGDGLCSMFGFNNYQVIYSGTVSGSLGTGASTSRKGWQNAFVNAAVNAPTSGHIGVIESIRQTDATFSDSIQGSGTTQQFTTRATFNQNVPEGCDMILQLRVFNGSVAPASNTTATFAFVDAQVFNYEPVNIVGVDAVSGKGALPVTLQTSQAVVGAGTHSAASSGAPVRVAGRVNTTSDITLVSGDTSDLFITSAGQLVVKQYATAEVDWQYASLAGGIVNTADVAVKVAAGASVRNYVTALQFKNTNAVATELVVKDGSTVIWRGLAAANMTCDTVIVFPTPLKGTANTAVNVACITTGAAVYVNIQGYSSF